MTDLQESCVFPTLALLQLCMSGGVSTQPVTVSTVFTVPFNEGRF